MTKSIRLALTLTILLAGGCAAAGMAHLPLSAVPAATPSALPAEILYVTNGKATTRHPYIEVFNAKDTSSQKPLYTIPSRRGGQYGALAVDEQNNLYVTNYFTGGTELVVVPSGKSKPNLTCVLGAQPGGTYITGKTLFMTTQSYTIEEYALPLTHKGQNCQSPETVLTDRRAKLRARAFLSVAVDPKGDIFDSWLSQGSKIHVDEFPAGSKNARPYPTPSRYNVDYMAFDSKGNLVTSVSSVTAGDGGDIGIFRPGNRQPTLYDAIPTGLYFQPALAGNDSELFIGRDYPEEAIEVFAYDPNAGRVGKLLRSFTNIWFYAQSIAVYAKS
jgi:hypothetical protein